MIYLQLFLSFLQVGLFSIGGGYAAMPLIQDQVIQRHSWLTPHQFTDLITIAEMTPGPIAVNSATFVGIQIAGLPGAIIATFGCIFPSCILVSLLSFFYQRYKKLDFMQRILSSLRPAIVALIASAGFSILQLLLFNGEALFSESINWFGGILFLAAFYLINKKNWNPIITILLCGFLYLFYHLIFLF